MDYPDWIIETLDKQGWFDHLGAMDHQEKRRLLRALWPPEVGDEGGAPDHLGPDGSAPGDLEEPRE